MRAGLELTWQQGSCHFLFSQVREDAFRAAYPVGQALYFTVPGGIVFKLQ